MTRSDQHETATTSSTRSGLYQPRASGPWKLTFTFKQGVHLVDGFVHEVIGYFRMNLGTPGADITKPAPRAPSNSLLKHLASTNTQETNECTQAFGGYVKYLVLQNAVEGVFCVNFLTSFVVMS